MHYLFCSNVSDIHDCFPKEKCKKYLKEQSSFQTVDKVKFENSLLLFIKILYNIFVRLLIVPKLSLQTLLFY